MTAKEIASYAKRNVKLSGVDMDEVYTYSFMPKQFEDFVNQLCKEQRELDAMLYRDIMYEALGNKKVTIGEMVERIRNNKQPEV